MIINKSIIETMKTYNRIIGITLAAIAIFLMCYAEAYAQNSNEFTVPLSEPSKRGKLKAHINYGSVTVKGTARKDILVKYTTVQDEDKNKEKTKDGLRRIGSGGMELQVTENNNSVTVNSGSWSNKLNLEIEIPTNMDVEAKTHNDGHLMVTNVQGEVELSNHNGEITALNISGSVLATTFNGDVKVTFDKVTEGVPMSYTTYNGDVNVSFPASMKATLKMKTEHGDIYSDFDVVFKNTGPVQKTDNKGGVYKVFIDDWKRGDINGGGPEMTMKNYNGDIYIRKK
jgi:hypothetical protein